MSKYFSDPFIGACINGLQYVKTMSYEEKGTWCVISNYKPIVKKMTVGEFMKQASWSSMLVTTADAWTKINPGTVAMPSLSWLAPVLLGTVGLGTGFIVGGYLVSPAYAEKVAAWQATETLPSETEILVLEFEGLTAGTTAITAASKISSWDDAENQWLKAEIYATSIAALNADIGFGQRKVTGPNGSVFHFTYVMTAAVCSLSLFHNFMWYDGQSWQNKILEKIVKHDGGCTPKDFVDLFHGLAKIIRDFVEQMKFTPEMYNSYAWSVVEDLIQVTYEMIKIWIAGAFGG